MTKLDRIIERLEAEVKDRKSKALKVKSDQGERQAYYVVHEVDGLEDALKIVKSFKQKQTN